MVITRGKGVGEEEEGKGGINGDGKFTWGGEHTIYRQTMYHRIVHLRPI